MTSKRMLICIGLLFLAPLTYAAPLVASNVTGMVTGTGAQLHLDLPHTLLQRSPVDPTGSTSGEGSAGAGAAGSSSSSSSVDGAMKAALRGFEKKGREYYMPIIMQVDVDRTNSMLANENRVNGDHKRWQINKEPTSFLGNGWTEQDLTAQLSQNDFTAKYGPTFRHLIVGQAEEGLVLAGLPNLRAASTILWPAGPNRMIRMKQSRPSKHGWNPNPGYADHPPTNAHHDAIYNIRDGILILLEQSPVSDTAEAEKDLISSMQYNQIWATDQVWFCQWRRQRMHEFPGASGITSVSRNYEQMKPKLKTNKVGVTEKLNDSRFIFVPDIRTRNEETRPQLLAAIQVCLSSVGAEMQVPGYSEFGSFFPAGSWCATTLLSIRVNTFLANFLARHQSDQPSRMRHKTIVGVHIIKLGGQPTDEAANPTLVWELADFKASDVDCASAWAKIPFGESLPLRVDPGAGASGSGKGKGREVIPLDCYPEPMRKWQPEAFGMPPAQAPDAEMAENSDDGRASPAKESDVEVAESSDDASDQDSESISSDASPSGRMPTDADVRAANALLNLNQTTGGSMRGAAPWTPYVANTGNTGANANNPGQGPAPAAGPSGAGQGANTGNTGANANNPGQGPAPAAGPSGAARVALPYDPVREGSGRGH